MDASSSTKLLSATSVAVRARSSEDNPAVMAR